MFKYRSDKKELLDAEYIETAALRRNLRELHTINRYLGGYSASIAGLSGVLRKNEEAVVVDLGSGGGDTLFTIGRWAGRKGYRIRCYGIDIRKDCVDYSGRISAENVSFVCDDYRNVLLHVPEARVLHASLFCHHLSQEEIGSLLQFARQNGLVLVINDLQRHPLAYYGIRLLTSLFSSSHLVKHDAPLSVLRGFTTREWKALLDVFCPGEYEIRRRWAFRHLIVVKNGNAQGARAI